MSRPKNHCCVISVLMVSFTARGAGSPGGYELSWHTIDNGGRSFMPIGTADFLIGTIAQPDAGAPMTDGEFTVVGGFWGALPVDQLLCTTPVGPDVIVGDISGWSQWGSFGNIYAYSFGATACNRGDADLPWFGASNQHPVIAAQAYRLKSGRFEQIGMSWVKHGWGAATDSLCCNCINPGNSQVLGVGCSDTYDSALNGDQDGFNIGGGVIVTGLGPRSQINANTGAFPWPYATIGQSGNAIYKRLQFRSQDIDPSLNFGAMYFGECYYVTPSDAAAGNSLNNASHRRFTAGFFNGTTYPLTWTDSTIREYPAIYAWAANDPSVALVNADVPGEGRFVLGYKASDNGNGTWHYEYALYNHNSDRSGSGFHVPAATCISVTNLGFHDVPYHSGDGAVIGTNYDGTDWAPANTGGQVTWSMVNAGSNSNALRWGTLYNFRFDASAPPANAQATLDLFVAGAPASITINAVGPRRAGDVDGNGAVNIDDLLAAINTWGVCPSPPTPCPGDLNGDGVVNIDDLLAVINGWGPCS
jgi:hypothetical protein